VTKRAGFTPPTDEEWAAICEGAAAAGMKPWAYALANGWPAASFHPSPPPAPPESGEGDTDPPPPPPPQSGKGDTDPPPPPPSGDGEKNDD